MSSPSESNQQGSDYHPEEEDSIQEIALEQEQELQQEQQQQQQQKQQQMLVNQQQVQVQVVQQQPPVKRKRGRPPKSGESGPPRKQQQLQIQRPPPPPSVVSTALPPAQPAITAADVGRAELQRAENKFNGMAIKNPVYNKFQVVDVKGLEYTIVCRLCNVYTTWNEKWRSPKTLHYHMKTYHPGEEVKQVVSGAGSIMSFVKPVQPANISAQKWHFYEEKSVKVHNTNLLEIIADRQPLGFLNGYGKRRALELNHPKYQIPSRWWVSCQGIPAAFKAAKRFVKLQMSGRLVAITTDGWTSASGLPFHSFTAHWIEQNQDGWSMVNRQIDIHHAPGRHTADYLVGLITQMCDDWGVQSSVEDKLIITADRAKNIRKAAEDLDKVEYVPCFSHTLHRAVVESIGNVRVMRSVVTKLTKLGLHFAKSTAGAGSFKAWQNKNGKKPRKPLSYSPTRWNGLYLAIERYLVISQDLRSYVTEEMEAEAYAQSSKGQRDHVDRVYSCLLEQDEEDAVTAMKPLLQKLYQATLELQTGDICTGVRYQRALEVLISTCNAATGRGGALGELGEEVADALKKRYRKSDMGTILVLNFFNPMRSSLMPSWWGESSVDEAIFKDDLKLRLEAQYKAITGKDVPVAPQSAPVAVQEVDIDFESFSLFGQDDTQAIVSVQGRRDMHPLEAEIEGILGERVVAADRRADGRSVCLLKFWRRLSTLYPLIGAIVCRYLGVPATSVLSEVVFSNVGEIVSSRRHSLTTEHVHQLSFLYLNIRYVEPAILGLKPGDYKDALANVYAKIWKKRQLEVMAQVLQNATSSSAAPTAPAPSIDLPGILPAASEQPRPERIHVVQDEIPAMSSVALAIQEQPDFNRLDMNRVNIRTWCLEDTFTEVDVSVGEVDFTDLTTIHDVFTEVDVEDWAAFSEGLAQDEALYGVTVTRAHPSARSSGSGRGGDGLVGVQIGRM